VYNVVSISTVLETMKLAGYVRSKWLARMFQTHWALLLMWAIQVWIQSVSGTDSIPENVCQ